MTHSVFIAKVSEPLNRVRTTDVAAKACARWMFSAALLLAGVTEVACKIEVTPRTEEGFRPCPLFDEYPEPGTDRNPFNLDPESLQDQAYAIFIFHAEGHLAISALDGTAKPLLFTGSTS